MLKNMTTYVLKEKEKLNQVTERWIIDEVWSGADVWAPRSKGPLDKDLHKNDI